MPTATKKYGPTRRFTETRRSATISKFRPKATGSQEVRGFKSHRLHQKFLMRASGFGRKFRRTIRPREIPARYPTRWPSHCTLSSRLPCDVHGVGNATQIARVQVGVGPKEDGRIVAECGSCGRHGHAALGQQARRRVTEHVRRRPSEGGRARCCGVPDPVPPVRQPNRVPCRRREHRRSDRYRRSPRGVPAARPRRMPAPRRPGTGGSSYPARSAAPVLGHAPFHGQSAQIVKILAARARASPGRRPQ